MAGVRDISVPILSAGGHAIAVLTCPFIHRLDEEADQTIANALSILQDVAERLSLS